MSSPHVQFGPFRLDLPARRLLRNGEAIPLAPKTFDLLALLADNPERAMSRGEIMHALWPDTAVEEGNLSFQISTLRKALGPNGSTWVETVPKHGYRFRASMAAVPEPKEAPIAPRSHRKTLAAAVAALAAAIAGGAALVRDRGPVEVAASIPLTSYRGSEMAPSFSPDGKAVAFQWDNARGRPWNIYLKLAGAEAPVQFTFGQAGAGSPAWSPDGRTIAFVRPISPTELQYVLKPYPDGPERTLLTARPCNPFIGKIRGISWHPDSRHIVIQAPGGSCGLAAFATDTGEIVRLTQPPPSQVDISPAVSPDGRTLAFVRGVGFPEHVLHAVRLSPDLDAVGSPWRVSPEGNGMELAAAWTPDSKELVVSSGTSFADFGLFRISASGGGKARKIPGVGTMSFWPAISRQGILAFAADAPGSASAWSVELPAGSAGAPVIQEVASSSRFQQSPFYSPDGRQIAFESERSGQHEVWTTGAEGGEMRQVTSMGAVAQSPAYSPDGGRIAFSAYANRQRDLYVVSARGGAVQRLTYDPADDAAAWWSQDGRWIYFHSNRTGAYEIWKMPSGGGAAAKLTNAGGMSPKESPDAAFVYYRKGSSVFRMPVVGGAESLVLKDAVAVSNFIPVNDGLFYTPVAPPLDELHSRICFLDFSTGMSRDVAAIPGILGWGLSVAPDRHKFLVARRLPGESDLRSIPLF